MVPAILQLTVEAWESLPAFAGDETENAITLMLCRALARTRSARNLPFQIRPQQAEIDPAPEEEMGRMDIAFNLLVPSEEIYFCLEGKRLNVPTGRRVRGYAAEYVTLGMMRFVTGRYSRAVRHGGMIGYVLDNDVKRAIAHVEASIKTQRVALRMARGHLVRSRYIRSDDRIRESRHKRPHDGKVFRLHHVFVACKR